MHLQSPLGERTRAEEREVPGKQVDSMASCAPPKKTIEFEWVIVS
jgi:hypothetical protein